MLKSKFSLCPSVVEILLVEDDDVAVMAVERAFNKLKVKAPLVRAKNGQEALQMLAAKEVGRPYIILLDLNMPVMDGLKFLEVLRADKSYCDSVVFVLTTSKAESDVVASYKQHVAGYFLKTDLGGGVAQVVDVLKGYCDNVQLPA